MKTILVEKVTCGKMACHFLPFLLSSLIKMAGLLAVCLLQWKGFCTRREDNSKDSTGHLFKATADRDREDAEHGRSYRLVGNNRVVEALSSTCQRADSCKEDWACLSSSRRTDSSKEEAGQVSSSVLVASSKEETVKALSSHLVARCKETSDRS